MAGGRAQHNERALGFEFEERPSVSPYVDRIWRTESGDVRSFVSVAASQWELVVSRVDGRVEVTVRGPETHATEVECAPEGEFFGIVFRRGSFMPELAPEKLVDTGVTVPGSGGSFRLGSTVLDVPAFDNVEYFLARLAREGLLVRDDVVSDALAGDEPDVSARSVQRRVLRATGLTRGGIRQIEAAREAAKLLRTGSSIADAIWQCSYSDQAHMTRSLKRLMGQTPGELVRSPSTSSLL